jgi:large subunit ribosomal protein L4
VKDLAKMSALAYKAKENAILIVEDFELATPKTKEVVVVLNNLQIGTKKSLFVIPEYNDNLYLSLRNLPAVTGTLLSDINTYDLVNNDVLVLTESAAKLFTEEGVAA